MSHTFAVLADYLFAIHGSTGTDWQIKGVAIAGYTVAFIGGSYLSSFMGAKI
jgi:hypothetical protein